MNKKSVSILFVVLSTMMIQTESCKKERTLKTYNVEQYVKDWMFFDTGTWWVYKELNSGEIDSQYVIKSEFVYTQTDPNNERTPYYKEQTGKVYTNRGYFFNLASENGNSVIEKITESGTERGSTFMFFKRLYIGGYPNGGNSIITAIDYNYQLNNLKDTLITILDVDDASENNESMEYKVFKGVGIVNKKNLTKKQEWQLVKYHINLNKG